MRVNLAAQVLSSFLLHLQTSSFFLCIDVLNEESVSKALSVFGGPEVEEMVKFTTSSLIALIPGTVQLPTKVGEIQ